MNFQVGQVVFIVLKKKQQVLPIRVVEEIKKKTLKGEEISYTVEVPIGDKLKIIPLAELDCDIFTSTQGAKDFLLSNASKFIDSLMTRAEKISANRFGESIKFEEALPVNNSNNEKFKVELENGVVANVMIPGDM